MGHSPWSWWKIHRRYLKLMNYGADCNYNTPWVTLTSTQLHSSTSYKCQNQVQSGCASTQGQENADVGEPAFGLLQSDARFFHLSHYTELNVWMHVPLGHRSILKSYVILAIKMHPLVWHSLFCDMKQMLSLILIQPSQDPLVIAKRKLRKRTPADSPPSHFLERFLASM